MRTIIIPQRRSTGGSRSHPSPTPTLFTLSLCRDAETSLRSIWNTDRRYVSMATCVVITRYQTCPTRVACHLTWESCHWIIMILNGPIGWAENVFSELASIIEYHYLENILFYYNIHFNLLVLFILPLGTQSMFCSKIICRILSWKILGSFLCGLWLCGGWWLGCSGLCFWSRCPRGIVFI